MRNINAAYFNALINSRETGIAPRQFVYFTAKLRTTGALVSLGLWTGDEDINISVISPYTGLSEARTYYGASNLVIGDVVRSSDLTIQSVSVSMSQIATAAQQLLRGYDIRLAKVEIHEMLFGPGSRLPVSEPEIIFLGEVDQAPLSTPAIGEDGAITISAVSDAISMLNITNPSKSSYEGQKRRYPNDEFGKYGGTVASWDIPWGKDAK